VDKPKIGEYQVVQNVSWRERKAAFNFEQFEIPGIAVKLRGIVVFDGLRVENVEKCLLVEIKELRDKRKNATGARWC
jgi:hypothetical protein